MPRKFGYESSAEQKANYNCCNCRNAQEYMCYVTDSSNPVLFFCRHCLLELYGTLGRFVRDTVLPTEEVH